MPAAAKDEAVREMELYLGRPDPAGGCRVCWRNGSACNDPAYRPPGDEAPEVRPPGWEEAARDITRDTEELSPPLIRTRIFVFLRALAGGDPARRRSPRVRPHRWNASDVEPPTLDTRAVCGQALDDYLTGTSPHPTRPDRAQRAGTRTFMPARRRCEPLACPADVGRSRRGE